MADVREEYLGDRLYVSIECDMIKLRAPRYDSESVVYMEPQILINLKKWIRDQEGWKDLMS